MTNTFKGTLEDVLDRRRVAQCNCGLHLIDRRNAHKGDRNVIGNPFHKLARVFILKVANCVLAGTMSMFRGE